MLMSAEENKALILRFLDEYRKGNGGIIDEVFSANFAFHSPANLDGPLRGLEGTREMIAKSAAIFPDLQATVEDIFAEGEKVAVRWTFRGTYRGEAKPGFPKPGERCTLVDISTYRFANSKIEDDWGVDAFWPRETPWK